MARDAFSSGADHVERVPEAGVGPVALDRRRTQRSALFQLVGCNARLGHPDFLQLSLGLWLLALQQFIEARRAPSRSQARRRRRRLDGERRVYHGLQLSTQRGGTIGAAWRPRFSRQVPIARCGRTAWDDVDRPPGTFTPLHHDLTDNFIAQIVGRKRLKLVPAPTWENSTTTCMFLVKLPVSRTCRSSGRDIHYSPTCGPMM